MELPIDSDILLRPVILALVALLISYIAFYISKPSPVSQLSKAYKLPIVGAREGDWFPYTQARWRNFFNFQSALLEAERLSRTADPNNPHQAVLLPVLGTPNLVQLPQLEIQFVAEQPQSNLSAHDHATGRLQIENTLSDPRLLRNPVHNRIISTSLGGQTGNLVPDLVEETASVFQDQWGTSNDFHEVNALNTLRQVVARTTYRVFLSAPLCRDHRIQEAAMAVFDGLGLIAEFLNLLWDPIVPLLAPLITIPVKRKFRHFQNLLAPEVMRRLEEYDARHQTTNLKKKKDTEPEQNDFLQWNLNHAKASGDPYMYSPSTLAGRILIVAFAGVHTTTFAITHAVLDIAYSQTPIRSQIISELREEITTCLNTHSSDGATFTKQALTSMLKLDSLLRESTRLNSLITIGLARKCTAPNGLTTPYSKITVPKGATVTVPAYTAFRSPELYDNPDEFQPFRFAAPCQQRGDEKERPPGSKAFASTGPDYLAFGYGKTACPGRFFVANELKLVLGYMLMNYDIEPAVEGMERPKNRWYGINMVPDLSAMVRIRRRSE
ncbi:cytochrome P450 [Rhypophila decipiens]